MKVFDKCLKFFKKEEDENQNQDPVRFFLYFFLYITMYDVTFSGWDILLQNFVTHSVLYYSKATFRSIKLDAFLICMMWIWYKCRPTPWLFWQVWIWYFLSFVVAFPFSFYSIYLKLKKLFRMVCQKIWILCKNKVPLFLTI